MSSKMESVDTPMSVNFISEERYRPGNESFRIFPSSPEEEIVISGLAGRYPNSDNAEELSYHLYNKVRSGGVIFRLLYFQL